ncbi:MAG: penicillin-binding transpeptidase domain-containing protein, partial [Hylemonella sp.]
AKVFSLAAVVDTGVATPDRTIQVPGTMVFGEDTQWEHTIRDAEPHNPQPMSLRDIIVHSSNIGTLMLTEEVGVERFGGYLLDNYLQTFEALQLDAGHARTLAANSLTASFAPEADKRRWLKALDACVDAG